MDKQFYIDQLNEVLENLKNLGIEGIKPVKQILEDVASSPVIWEAQILKNDQFELVFIGEIQKVEFRTTFSNLVIDREFINKLMIIDQNKDDIESLLQKISQFK